MKYLVALCLVSLATPACGTDEVAPMVPSVGSEAPELPQGRDVLPLPDVPLPELPEPEVSDPGPLPEPMGPGVEVPRTPRGEPLTDEEVEELTAAATSFWKDTGYWRWVRMTSHGLDPAVTAEGAPYAGQQDYALWWQDTRTIREGDTVRFEHYGRADNLTLRTSKVLTNAIAGYLMTGDEDMRWVAIQYSKGLAALGMAMEFGADDPVKYLQARAIFSHDHTYETVEGRKVSIDYEPVRRDEEAWNAAIIHNPDNPHFGDIWLVNQRSKDDVPHMFRAVPMLLRASGSEDAELAAAADLALEYLRGFAQDMIDSGFQIRTKFADGEAVVPVDENGVIKDLASLVLYDAVLGEDAECNGKLSTALVAQGASLGLVCEEWVGLDYEKFAGQGHYFNYAIIRYFHIAAAHNALMVGEQGTAERALTWLASRADRIMHPDEQPPGYEVPNSDEDVWWSDAAAFLLASAAAGLPLTDEEAQLIRQEYLASFEHYRQHPHWDPWAGTEEGEFPYKPSRGVAVRPTELAYLLEYCYSPFRHPAGARVVDCAVISDQARW